MTNTIDLPFFFIELLDYNTCILFYIFQFQHPFFVAYFIN